jgi:hypothetical protein
MSDETKAATLILDILGPFVVHFCKSDRGGNVRICAPLCKDHHANILTDNVDISLNGLTQPNVNSGYIYELINSSSQDIKPEDTILSRCEIGGNPILMLEEDKKEFDLIQERTCHLIFLAPRPDVIFGLRPEPIWIHQNGAQRWVELYGSEKGTVVSQPRSRGLRFVYRQWPDEPSISIRKSLILPDKTMLDSLDGSLKNLGALSSGSAGRQYNITLRFSSNDSSPDTHHEDAFNCFQTMRSLVPDTSTWLTAFDHGGVPSDPKANNAQISVASKVRILVVGGEHPVDCPASPMVRRDKGTQLAFNPR